MDRLKIIILAGGFGTRLGDKNNFPKGLIASGNTTIIGRIINDLISLQPPYQLAVVSNNYYYQLYQQYFRRAHSQLKIILINNHVDDNQQRLGAIGDLNYAINQLSWVNDNLLVLASDTYYRFSLKNFVEYSLSKQGLVTVFRYFNNLKKISRRLGCALFDRNNRLTKFIEKPITPPSHYGAVPIYFYPKSLVQKGVINRYVKSGNNVDPPGAIIPWLMNNHYPVYAYIVDGYTLDVGTAKDVITLRRISRLEK